MSNISRIPTLADFRSFGTVKSFLRRVVPQGSFGQSIALLGGGTALGQGLAVLATPVLTRLFTPSDFGTLGAFIAMVWIWCQTIAWQYDQAIPVAKEDDVARSLLVLSLAVAGLMAVVIGIVSGPLAPMLFGSLKSTGLLPYLWLMPFGVLGAGLFQTLNCWAVREKEYWPMANARVGQSFAVIAAQFLGGLFWLGPLGLLLGDVVGRCLGTGFLAMLLWRKRNASPERISLAKVSAAAKRYWRFPAFSMGAALVSNASIIMPPLLFAAFFSAEEAGWFALAIRVVGAPSFLVGQAVGNVYWAEAADRVRNQPHALKGLFYRIVTRLITIFLIPMAILAAIGPWLFALVFGEVWRPAGEFVRFLALPFLLRIAVGPISMTLNILERQDWQMFWDVFRAILVIGGIWLAHHLGWSSWDAVKMYAVTMAVCYISVIIISTMAINRRITAHGAAIQEQV